MSTRTRWPESEIEPERHQNRYERRKSEIERQRDLAKEVAAQARAKPPIDIAKLKRKLASKKIERPTEQAERKGGPLPSDFHWGHYPDED
jgi:hypothetical protein